MSDTLGRMSSHWAKLENLTRESFDLLLSGFEDAQSNRKREEIEQSIHRARLELHRNTQSSQFVFRMERRTYSIDAERVVDTFPVGTSALLTKRVKYGSQSVPLIHLKRKLGIMGELGSIVMLVRTGQSGASTVEAWAVDAVVGAREVKSDNVKDLPQTPGHFPERKAIDYVWKQGAGYVYHLHSA